MIKILKIHIFNYGRLVNFIGGKGIVKRFKLEDRVWTYLIEMPLGIEPTFGRVGVETMIRI